MKTLLGPNQASTKVYTTSTVSPLLKHYTGSVLGRITKTDRFAQGSSCISIQFRKIKKVPVIYHREQQAHFTNNKPPTLTTITLHS
jgi:hypothetical protein